MIKLDTMPTYSDVVKNPRIPRENAGSQANNQNKRRVYNKSQTNRKKTTNTRKSNPPQQPFSFNLFLGNMGGNGMPQILADRALLGLMNAQNIPNGVQPIPPVQPVPPPGGGHILGDGFNADDRQQLQDVVDIQQMFSEEQQNIRRAINNNAFNQERQDDLRDKLIQNQNNNRQFLELLTNQTQTSLKDIRENTLDTQMNGLKSRQLIETVNNRTIELENQINTSRQEHNQNMKQMKTMFNMMLTPGSDKKKLNDTYNERRDELRNDPQGFLDVIFENKDLGAPRQSPHDLEAGAREEKSPSPSIYVTPKTPHAVPTHPRIYSTSKRLDIAKGAESSDDVKNETKYIPRTPGSRNMFISDSEESDHEQDDALLEEDSRNASILREALNQLQREDDELDMLGEDLRASVKKNLISDSDESDHEEDNDLLDEDAINAFNQLELEDGDNTRRSTRNRNQPDRFKP